MKYQEEILKDWDRYWNSAAHDDADDSPFELNMYELEHGKEWDLVFLRQKEFIIFHRMKRSKVK